MIWENPPEDMGAKTAEDRRKDAQGQLDEYNCWANGQVYGYEMKTAGGREKDSCWGFYGMDYILKDLGLKPGDRVKVTGDAANHPCWTDWPAGVEVFKAADDLPEDWGWTEKAERLALACGTL